MKKIIFNFLICLIIIVFIRHLISIPQQKTNIDNLEEILLPIKESLSFSSCVSYISSTTSLERYYQTQFVMVPVIVEEKLGNNTIILIEDLNIKSNVDSLLSNEYLILQNHISGNIKASLIKIKKY